MGFACLFSLLLVFDWVALIVIKPNGKIRFFWVDIWIEYPCLIWKAGFFPFHIFISSHGSFEDNNIKGNSWQNLI